MAIFWHLDYVSVMVSYHDGMIRYDWMFVLIELIEWWTTKSQVMYLPLYKDLDIVWNMYVYINVTMDFK